MSEGRGEPRKWTPEGFSRHVGFHDFHHHPNGEVTVELDVEARHLNQGGIVHGGVLLSMLDSVMGGAVVATLREGEWTATESLTTNFMRPAVSGRIGARGWVERRGRLTAFVSGEVTNEEGRVLGRATGVWAVRSG